MIMRRRKYLYIANRHVTTNDYGIDIETFDKPERYDFFYMPSTSSTDYELYGRKINEIYIAFIDYNRYFGKFKVGDRAYLIDDETTDISFAKNDINGEKANYKIVANALQNIKIKLTFAKIK